MGRGPYEKSGIIEDTGLPPNRPVRERFDIFFPTEDVVEGGRTVRKTLEREMTVEVKLWYLPYGSRTAEPFLWREFTKTLSVSAEGM